MLRPATHNDIDELINIHLTSLGDGLLAKLGKHFLKKVFYPACLQSPDVLILVYEQQKKVISFVIYTQNSMLLTQSLLNKKIPIGIAVLKNILIKPSLLLDIAIMLKGFKVQMKPGHEEIMKHPAELYLIGTNPAYQGKGIGSILVSQGLTAFTKQFNVSTCLVKTSSSRAYQFYLANQFSPVGTEYRGKHCFHILYKNTATMPQAAEEVIL